MSGIDLSRKPDTSWFVEARFGMFIHWGLYAMAARHEWVRSREKIRDENYQPYYQRFDPDLYDPAEWARLAKQAGMKYFVITAKHHEGFCLWDTQFTDFKATKTPAGRDLLRPMVEAFRAEGLKVGFYYSLLDWNHPEFPVDKYHPYREDQDFRQKTKGRNVHKYAEYMRNQVRELLTQFGRIDVMWFDFSYPGEDGKGRDDWESEKLYSLVRELQPHVLIDNRLDLPGSESFVTPEQFMPHRNPTDEQGRKQVWEGCHTFSGSWGYARDEESWKSPKQCLELLIDHVSMGGNLLMNVGPTGRGEFDYRAKERLEAFGRWMRLHGRSIYGCGQAPEGFANPQGAKLTYNPKTNRLYVHMLRWPFHSLYLPTFGDKVRYAQLLNDGSEIPVRHPKDQPEHEGHLNREAPSHLLLPTKQPPVEIPVIELFLS